MLERLRSIPAGMATVVAVQRAGAFRAYIFTNLLGHGLCTLNADVVNADLLAFIRS